MPLTKCYHRDEGLCAVYQNIMSCSLIAHGAEDATASRSGYLPTVPAANLLLAYFPYYVTFPLQLHFKYIHSSTH